MFGKTSQKQKPNNPTKCIRCGKSAPTKEDNMCDSCRFMITLENIVEKK